MDTVVGIADMHFHNSRIPNLLVGCTIQNMPIEDSRIIARTRFGSKASQNPARHLSTIRIRIHKQLLVSIDPVTGRIEEGASKLVQ
jgi:hypothetical protein